MSPDTRDSIGLTADILGILAFVWAVAVSLVAFFKKPTEPSVNRPRFKKNWLPDIASMFVPSGPITLGIAQPVFKKNQKFVHEVSKKDTRFVVSSPAAYAQFMEGLRLNFLAITHPDSDHFAFKKTL